MEKSKMKIGFVGSQGTGKTTLSYELAAELKKRGHDVYVLSEVARSCPLPINEETTKESQLWIIGKQMTREQSAKGKIYVSDRTILDPYCYGMRIDPDFFKDFESFIKAYLRTYDYIFYMPPNDDYLMDDGTRSTDTKFRDEIDSLMKWNLDKLKAKYVTLDDNNVNVVLKHLGFKDVRN